MGAPRAAFVAFLYVQNYRKILKLFVKGSVHCSVQMRFCGEQERKLRGQVWAGVRSEDGDRIAVKGGVAGRMEAGPGRS